MAVLTKMAFAAALKERLKTTPLDNIRVKDIAADVGVNRQTFYYHFTDIYALVEWMFEEEAKKIVTDNFRQHNIGEIMRSVILRLEEDKVVLKNIYVSLNRQLLDDYLRKWVRPIVSIAIRDAARGSNVLEEDLEFIINVYETVVMALAFEFIETDITFDYGNKLEKLSIIMDGDIEETIRRFEKK